LPVREKSVETKPVKLFNDFDKIKLNVKKLGTMNLIKHEDTEFSGIATWGKNRRKLIKK